MNYIQSSWDSFLSSFCIKHLTFTISSARLRSIIVSNHCQVKTISSFKFYQYSKLRSLCKSWKFCSSLQHTEWVRNLLSTLMSVCTDLFACDFISIVWAYSHISTLVYICKFMCSKKQYRPVLKQMQKLWWFSMAVMLVTNVTTWIARWLFIWPGGQKGGWVNLLNIPCLWAWWWIGIYGTVTCTDVHLLYRLRNNFAAKTSIDWVCSYYVTVYASPCSHTMQAAHLE